MGTYTGPEEGNVTARLRAVAQESMSSHGDTVRIEAAQLLEDLIIDDIIRNDIGDRFVIEDLVPHDDSVSGSVTIKGDPVSKVPALTTRVPRDEIPFKLMVSGPRAELPEGNLSVLRFSGNIGYHGYMIESQGQRPISFLLLGDAGLVYLHGRGKVTQKNGTVVTLPATINSTSDVETEGDRTDRDVEK